MPYTRKRKSSGLRDTPKACEARPASSAMPSAWTSQALKPDNSTSRMASNAMGAYSAKFAWTRAARSRSGAPARPIGMRLDRRRAITRTDSTMNTTANRAA